MEKGKLVILIVALAVFSFSLNNPTAYAGSDGFPFSIAIDDVLLEEGDVGTTDFVFTVSVICEGACGTFSMGYSTTPDTATEADDYNGVTDGLVTLFPGGGNTASGTITIQVNGDTDVENDETFFVDIFDCSVGCSIVDSQGIGTIQNDDVVSSPDDVFVVMGACCNDDPQAGSLASADLDTGILTQIGDAVAPQVGMNGLSGLAIDSTGRFFVTAVQGGSSSSRLLELDRNTGAIIIDRGSTFFESEGFFDVKLRDLSFQPGTNILFGVGQGAEINNGLFTVDTQSAQVELIGIIDTSTIQGIAFAPDGTLYGTDGCALFTINPEDPTVPAFVTGLSTCYDGLGIDSAGQIFGTTSGESLHLINPDDGSDVTVAGEGTNPSDVDFLRELPLPESGTAYVSVGNNSGENLDNGAIGTVDFESGEITQIGPQITDGGLSGLTFDSNGNLFGSEVFGCCSSSNLYQIDPVTGDGTLINTILIIGDGSFPLKIRDLATQPGTDVIFGIGHVVEGGDSVGCPSFNSLFTIDPTDATADCIGTFEGTGEASIGGIGFAPDGTLYATASGCFDPEDNCFSGYLASFNPDGTFAGFFLELGTFFDGLGIRPSDGGFFATTGLDSVHQIDLETGETPTVAGVGDQPSDITFFPFDAPLASGTGGQGYEGPTLGEFDDGRLIVSDGFCFDRFCLDVLDYFNHLPIQQVDSGTTHTISMTAYCSAGSNRCNYASVGAAPPGTDINSIDWNVMLKRTGNSNDWQVTKVDPNGMLGDVTGTVQIVDASRIQYTFNIQFITPASIGTVDGNAEPPADNMILVTEIRDSKGGSGRNIFNEGVFVNDIYAYPQVDASYASPVKVTPLCLNEDASDRNTCAFELVRQWAIKQAEEKLKEIYEQNNYKTD